jgi:hypothetical protein
MLGASVLLAADEEGLGPTGLVLSAGLMVGHADAPPVGSSSFLAPMNMVGFDFFPPFLLRCLFWDDDCPGKRDLKAKS